MHGHLCPVIHYFQSPDDVVSPVLLRVKSNSQPLIVHRATLSSWPVAVAGLLKGGWQAGANVGALQAVQL